MFELGKLLCWDVKYFGNGMDLIEEGIKRHYHADEMVFLNHSFETPIEYFDAKNKKKKIGDVCKINLCRSSGPDNATYWEGKLTFSDAALNKYPIRCIGNQANKNGPSIYYYSDLTSLANDVQTLFNLKLPNEREIDEFISKNYVPIEKRKNI